MIIVKNFGLQDDIKAAKEIMKNGKNYILNKGFEEHDQIYPYNNEYIKHWTYKQLNLIGSLFKIEKLYDYINLTFEHVCSENHDNFLL